MGQQMVTFRAGSTAVSWQQDGIVTLRGWAVLFNVLTVYFPKHLATTTLLLEEKHTRETNTLVAQQISPENTQSKEFCLSEAS